jgi:CelD/BcsL family acetyltransferase involved in cellulose biosynthesis
MTALALDPRDTGALLLVLTAAAFAPFADDGVMRRAATCTTAAIRRHKTRAFPSSPLMRAPLPSKSGAAPASATPPLAPAGPGCIVLEDAASLAAHRAEWDDLAANAAEPNVFYESWMLLPAIESFARAGAVQVVLVYADDGEGGRTLCGLFPLERMSRYRGLPLAHLRLWRHSHCYLATPLLRKGREREGLAAFFAWLARDPRSAPVMSWEEIGGDGPLLPLLVEMLAQDGRATYLPFATSRALLRPRADAEAYFAEAYSARMRKDLRRRERRLAERGQVTHQELAPGADAVPWIEDFLALEASGWKGQRGSALHCTERGREFFRRAAREAARRGRLRMAALCVDGRRIAMQCDFTAQEGAFAFKVAYDEAYARFGPGILLELENIRRLHRDGAPCWMDSCAEPDHEATNRLWMDRRAIATLVAATGRGAGEFLVSLLPLLRWASRKLPSKA